MTTALAVRIAPFASRAAYHSIETWSFVASPIGRGEGKRIRKSPRSGSAASTRTLNFVGFQHRALRQAFESWFCSSPGANVSDAGKSLPTAIVLVSAASARVADATRNRTTASRIEYLFRGMFILRAGEVRIAVSGSWDTDN